MAYDFRSNSRNELASTTSSSYPWIFKIFKYFASNRFCVSWYVLLPPPSPLSPSLPLSHPPFLSFSLLSFKLFRIFVSVILFICIIFLHIVFYLEFVFYISVCCILFGHMVLPWPNKLNQSINQSLSVSVSVSLSLVSCYHQYASRSLYYLVLLLLLSGPVSRYLIFIIFYYWTFSVPSILLLFYSI